jgi:hypothetical protein
MTRVYVPAADRVTVQKTPTPIGPMQGVEKPFGLSSAPVGAYDPVGKESAVTVTWASALAGTPVNATEASWPGLVVVTVAAERP